ncbi:hypothetical protein QEN71_40100 (plasmid) [Paraburkholderia sabiae]|uniref:hypothetical protein n=1 Tax=Paraburkholderia sabiae TaxID=273251 RepID=UPI0025B73F37|nr:hypothetical protein [Paraburkholderia sabiae]WJZ79519.1 hypothetical protein QEN71_40100 [Paraburkholderia sabiae]
MSDRPHSAAPRPRPAQDIRSALTVAAFEWNAKDCLRRRQMFRTFSCQEPRERMNRGKPGITRGNAVVAVLLKRCQELSDRFSVDRRKIQTFNPAVSLR